MLAKRSDQDISTLTAGVHSYVCVFHAYVEGFASVQWPVLTVLYNGETITISLTYAVLKRRYALCSDVRF